MLDIIYDPAAVIPGGSVLNSAVSLARSGVSVQLMTEFAEDGPGTILKQFLENENIGLDYSCIYKDAKTALAFALLDENAKATYTFYKAFPSKRFDIVFPVFNKESIFLYGSFSAINDELSVTVQQLVSDAESSGSMVYYDPNFRKAASTIDAITRERLNFNFSHADVIRGSDEDFDTIFGTIDILDVWKKVKVFGCKLLIVTYGARKVEAINDIFHLYADVPALRVVSTIGAGDSFNAGFIRAYISQSEKEGIAILSDVNHVKKCVNTAIEYASSVCLQTQNYISADIASQVALRW